MKIKTIIENSRKTLQITPENKQEEEKLDLVLEGCSDIDNWQQLKQRLEYNLKKCNIEVEFINKENI